MIWLFVTLSAVYWMARIADIWTTRRALAVGARESNPDLRDAVGRLSVRRHTLRSAWRQAAITALYAVSLAVSWVSWLWIAAVGALIARSLVTVVHNIGVAREQRRLNGSARRA